MTRMLCRIPICLSSTLYLPATLVKELRELRESLRYRSRLVNERSTEKHTCRILLQYPTLSLLLSSPALSGNCFRYHRCCRHVDYVASIVEKLDNSIHRTKLLCSWAYSSQQRERQQEKNTSVSRASV